jgi:cytochrome P450
VRGHINAFASTGECDVVADLAVKYPTEAILTLLGLPLEHLPQFMDWVQGIIKNASAGTVVTPTPRQSECAMALLIPPFVEEVLRLDGPVPMVPRTGKGRGRTIRMRSISPNAPPA